MTGRPRLFDSPEQMEERIEAYFLSDEANPPTIAGLCFFLGFSERHALSQYEQYDGFSATVKRARLRIEQDRSERLLTKEKFTPGLIFDLKNNHGWRDNLDLNHGGQEGNPVETISRIELVAPGHDDSAD